MNKQRGTSLLESLLTVAVLATFTAVSVPKMQDLAHGPRASAVANELLGSLNLARSEAMARASRVAVSPLVETRWSAGWRVYADNDGNGRYDAGRDELLREVIPPKGVEIVPRFGAASDGGVLSFNAEGLMRRPGSAGLMLGRITIASAREVRTLCVASIRIRATTSPNCS